MLKAILFDLDGTLLPMDQDYFMKLYFGSLAKKVAPLNYDMDSFVDNVWAGTVAMVKNDGSRTNREAFWARFSELCQKDCLKDEPVFDGYYSNEFSCAKAACGYNPAVRELMEYIKAKGKTLVLATNPLFPAVATENRMSWAGLSPEDFTLYTTYENSSYCKPNPKYYEEILNKIHCRPEECLMVGNDATEDMIAETLGMKVFLLTDCLLNKNGIDISRYPQGSFDELKLFIEQIL